MQRHTATNLTCIPSPMDHTRREGEVDLWSASVDGTADLGAALALLDDAERARADRYRFQRDRDRYVARHAFVRRVLAGYLDVEPATVAIRTASQGKPELDPACGVFFNTSCSDGLAVVAVTRGRRVGVDIERVRHLDDVTGVALGLMTERETELLRSAPQASRSAAFLTLWTRKESFVKAVGGGLSIPLDSFDSSTVGDDGIGRPCGPLGDLPFVFVGLDGLGGYIGAVTAEGQDVAVRQSRVGEVTA